jgi:hypothetical protein
MQKKKKSLIVLCGKFEEIAFKKKFIVTTPTICLFPSNQWFSGNQYS